MDKEQNLFFDALLSAYAERKKNQEQKKSDEEGQNLDKSNDKQKSGLNDDESR